MNEQHRFECPCCRFQTLPRQPPGTFELCPVCFWEDDNVQYRDPKYRGGANVVSLNEARENFIKFGASEERFIGKTRRPRPEETSIVG